MGDIQDLIDVDSKNVVVTLKYFDNYDKKLMECFETAASLFRSFSHVYSQEATDDYDIQEVDDIVERLQLENQDELNRMLDHNYPPDPSIQSEVNFLGNIESNYYSRRVRGMLLLLCYRSYMFSATDMLRMRITSALGNMRLAIESAAYTVIIRNIPEVGKIWFNLRTDKEGKRFYRKHSSELGKIIEQYSLEFLWNFASSSTQHARPHSVAFGIDLSNSIDRDRYSNEFGLRFQELDQDSPDDFFLKVLFLLRIQERIFSVLKEGLSEIADPILLETRLPSFSLEVSRLWQLLGLRFPTLLERMRESEM